MYSNINVHIYLGMCGPALFVAAEEDKRQKS